MAPTFVLIPGAWHSEDIFSPLIERLKALGYPSQTVQLPSVGGYTTVAEDANYVDKRLTSLLDRPTNAVVVAHSYASFAVGPALEHASRRSLAQGQKGSVVGIVYIAAFVPPEGATLEAMVGGTLPPWQAVDEEKMHVTVPDPLNTFYLDVASSDARQHAATLKPQSLKSFRSPAGSAGYKDSAYDGRRAYIHCEDDRALPPFAQEAMVKGSGVEWEVKVVKSSHSPFLSQVDETADYLVELAKRWDS